MSQTDEGERHPVLLASSKYCAPAIAELVTAPGTTECRMGLILGPSGLHGIPIDKALSVLVRHAILDSGRNAQVLDEFNDVYSDLEVLCWATRLIWFFDEEHDATPAAEPGTPANKCAFLACLGERLGLPVEARGRDGSTIPLPLTGDVGTAIHRQADEWQQDRKEFTAALDGFKLIAQGWRVVLETPDGEFFNGMYLDLSLDAIRRLRDWSGAYYGWDDSSHTEAEEKEAKRAREAIIATLLAELGPRAKIE